MAQRWFAVTLQTCFVVYETSWGSVDNAWILIFGWTVPLRSRNLCSRISCLLVVPVLVGLSIWGTPKNKNVSVLSKMTLWRQQHRFTKRRMFQNDSICVLISSFWCYMKPRVFPAVQQNLSRRHHFMKLGGRKRCRRRKTSKAGEEAKDVVGRANSSQRRAPPLCGFFFFLQLPPDPAASLTTSPPLEKHKQLKSPLWARASQNISQSLVEDERHYDTYHMNTLHHITGKSYKTARRPTTDRTMKDVTSEGWW